MRDQFGAELLRQAELARLNPELLRQLELVKHTFATSQQLAAQQQHLAVALPLQQPEPQPLQRAPAVVTYADPVASFATTLAPPPADAPAALPEAAASALLSQIQELHQASHKRSWTTAFPTACAPPDALGTQLTSALAQATAAGTAGASHLLSHLASTLPGLNAAALGPLALLTRSAQPTQAALQLATLQQGAQLMSSLAQGPVVPPPAIHVPLGPPPPSAPVTATILHPCPAAAPAPQLASLSDVLHPLLILAAAQQHHHQPPPLPPALAAALDPLSAPPVAVAPALPSGPAALQQSHLMRLSLQLHAHAATLANSSAPPAPPPQPSQPPMPPTSSPPGSPKGFQEYHKVVSSMPPELQARLRKKIRIIQPISQTWQEEALQPPATSDSPMDTTTTTTTTTTANPATTSFFPPPPPPSSQAGFRSYRHQRPPPPPVCAEGQPPLPPPPRTECNSRSTTSSPNALNSPSALPPPPRPRPSQRSTMSEPLLPPRHALWAASTSTAGPSNEDNPHSSAPSSATVGPHLPPPPPQPHAGPLAALPAILPPRSAHPISCMTTSSAQPTALPPPWHPNLPLGLQLPQPGSATTTIAPATCVPPPPLATLPPPALPSPALLRPPSSAPMSPGGSNPPPLPIPSTLSQPPPTFHPPGPPTASPFPPGVTPSVGVLSTVQGQLSVLYHWYIQNKSVYLEHAKQLLTMLDATQPPAAAGPAAPGAAPPAAAPTAAAPPASQLVDTPAVLKAFEKAIQIMQASQAVETHWVPAHCTKQASPEKPACPSASDTPPVEAKC